MNRRIYQIIRDKREWEEPLEPAEAKHLESAGSKGWYTRGYLPHCDKPGLIQMITYRLADAMPAAHRREWEALLAIEDEQQRRTKIEAYLDKGYGKCHLRDRRVAALIEENLLHFDGQRYRLTAWVVMPNHVHVLAELWETPLPQVVLSWKNYTARVINRLLGRSGRLWETDFWDRYIRDEAHFNKAKHYIEWNPVKAGLVRSPGEWAFGSGNLKWQWDSSGDRTRYRGASLLREGAQGARKATSAQNDQPGGVD